MEEGSLEIFSGACSFGNDMWMDPDDFLSVELSFLVRVFMV